MLTSLRVPVAFCQRACSTAQFTALVFCLGLQSAWVSASDAVASETIPSSVIETRIETVRNSPELSDSEKSEAIERLQSAVAQNRIAKEANDLSNQYDSVLSNPDVQTKESWLPAAKPLNRSELQNASQEKLSSLILERQIALAAFEARLELVNSNARAERSTETQNQLSLLRSQVGNATFEATTDKTTGATSGDRQLSPEEILQLTSERARLAQIKMLEKRALSYRVRLEQRERELDYIAEQTSRLRTQLEDLQRLNASARQSAASARTAEISRLISQLDGTTSAAQPIAEKALSRANELEKLTARHETLKREALKAREVRSRLQERYQSVTQQLSLFQFNSSPEFGAALREQRDQITGTGQISRRVQQLEEDLTEGRLRQFQLDDLQLGQRFTESTKALDGPGLELQEINAELIDELAIGYANYVQDINQLAEEDRRYVRDSKAYAALLDQSLLWMPSTSYIGGNSLRALPDAIAWLSSPEKWRDTLANAYEELTKRPLRLLLLVLLLGLLLHRRPALKAALETMVPKVGKVNLDSHAFTYTALAITILLAAPGAITLYLVSRLVDSPEGFGSELAHALRYGALLYLILDIMLQSVRRHGLARIHFSWRPTTVDSLRAELPWFMSLFIPAIVINLLLEANSNAAVRDSLGRIAFVFATLVLAIFAYRTMSPERGIFRNTVKEGGEKQWHIEYVAFPVLVLLPAMVAGLSAYGYHYTAVQLDAYFLNSLLLVLLGLLVFYIAERAVSINERRLSLARIRAKRAAAIAESEDREAAIAAGEELPSKIEVEEIDLQTISSQTRSLLRVLVGLGLGFALWNLWADLLPAFKPLSNVHLWGGAVSQDGSSFSGDVTLWELLLAAATAVLTFIAGRNISSLLEISVLSRLTLEPGTNYAITTLTRYIIVITGSVITLQLLGAQWSKLQWLVAALSVGLGFGLQEIVANFVSGIVLLFERPIRIGDTVTVGDQFGTVSRIRIRATTMVDWDRREIVIPNKTFITERLVNWTLTDPITRAVLYVGVAYGSDVNLTEELLHKIADENASVLNDPPPMVVFSGFGESSLDFELRVFVRGVRELVSTKHEINKAIDRRFREHNIEIAFPQRDLHIDAKPIEVQIIDPEQHDKN